MVPSSFGKVREITGKGWQAQVDGVDPVSINVHYATTPTDLQSCAPVRRHTCCPLQSWPSEETVFLELQHMKPTSPGSDGLLAWFLKLAALALSGPLALLYRKSLSDSVVPIQWKTACIILVPKIAQPTTLTDHRPI